VAGQKDAILQTLLQNARPPLKLTNASNFDTIEKVKTFWSEVWSASTGSSDQKLQYTAGNGVSRTIEETMKILDSAIGTDEKRQGLVPRSLLPVGVGGSVGEDGSVGGEDGTGSGSGRNRGRGGGGACKATGAVVAPRGSGNSMHATDWGEYWEQLHDWAEFEESEEREDTTNAATQLPNRVFSQWEQFKSRQNMAMFLFYRDFVLPLYHTHRALFESELRVFLYSKRPSDSWFSFSALATAFLKINCCCER
jgi:hypothetical protein